MSIGVHRIKLKPAQLKELEKATAEVHSNHSEDGKPAFVLANLWLAGGRRGELEVFVVGNDKGNKILDVLFDHTPE